MARSKKLKFPMDYEAWCKLPSTIKAMKIIMADFNNNQLEFEFEL